MSFKNPSTSSLRSSLVEKVLEQGQRLRNAMVKSILDNDPFYTEMPEFRRPQVYFGGEKEEKDEKGVLELTEDKSKLLKAFLHGDQMCVADEIDALNTLRSMSSDDYHKLATYLNSSCYLKESTTRLNEAVPVVPPIELKEEGTVNEYMKYADSLMITVHSLKLNEAGNRKVNYSDVDPKYRYPPSTSHTYFVEYQIPDLILKNATKTKSKVQSGLETNVVRICSKKLHNKVVQFKQTSVHDLISLQQINLEDIHILFKVSTRTLKQKKSNTIGCCKFELYNLAKSDYLSGCYELPVRLNEDTPIIVGNMKASFELGAGRLYFGKEFIDIITSSVKRNEHMEEILVQNTPDSGRSCVEITLDGISNKSKNADMSVFGRTKDNTSRCGSVKEKTPKLTPAYSLPQKSSVATKELNETLLLGLLYISEAQYVDKTTVTYFNCRPFCLETVIFSRTLNDTTNPIFNFYQLVPLIYDEELLRRFRDNHMIVEFVDKRNDGEEVIGITELPLHQFYIAYKNPVIVKYLLQNKTPIIAVDWWEPIKHPTTGDIKGQVQVLLALGSESQIKKLDSERGFKNDVVKARSGFSYIPKPPDVSNKKNAPKLKDDSLKKATNLKTDKNNRNNNNKGRKIDVAIQSDFDMEPKPTNKEVPKKAEDMLGEFLEQLMAQKQKNIFVENSTNTDTIKNEQPDQTLLNEFSKQSMNTTNLELRKTSELLDSLHQALNLNQNFCNNSHRAMSCPVVNDSGDFFKAHVFIEGALHLPVRRKCKSKKSKANKNAKQEEMPPSTYVTFETVPGQDLVVTPVVNKSTNPSWNFHHDAVLPVDLLTNNQKRLIFKVWNKSNSSPQPNFQNDIIIGFAALDLNVLIAGLPTIQGWFNIVDFASKCNGQIKINLVPLEDLSKYQQHKCSLLSSSLSSQQQQQHQQQQQQKDEISIALDLDKDESSELSRALKRKFTELDEITQRLRLRLSNVTNDESDASNDDLADEFEHDINTLCIEDDFDMVNFERQEQQQKSDSQEHDLLQIKTLPTVPSCVESDSMTSLDKNLIAGKQRIDNLLEKLSLISNNETENAFQNRYVSGCSVSNESVTNLDPTLFEQLCKGPFESESISSLLTKNSSSSLLTFADNRPAPDGAGNYTDEKTSSSTDT